MIKRVLNHEIISQFFKGKAIILIGPRQVGKTTLITELLEANTHKVLRINGDDPTANKIFSEINTSQLQQIIGDASIVFIDEAQRIPDIGITSKLIIDEFKSVQLIISGSSALDINQLTQEPLTGRKWTYHLWPISWGEWQDHIGYLESEQDLENRLVFGMYPDVLNHPENQPRVLKEIAESYLYKDVLSYLKIKKPLVLEKLLEALAFQIGSEVNRNELGQLVGTDSKTVEHYINILEKALIVFRLPSFSRNLRNEIKKNQKIYFHDNGIRNAIIGNLNPLSGREDTGALWENFLMSERKKLISYGQKLTKSYFWRTKQQQEIDYVEEESGQLCAYEFKWNPKKAIRFPQTFTRNYNAEIKGISKENFREFLRI